ncbi:PilZ domain-containing protein [Agaribacterium haliotis]|uniref:PilZ domain-containing protein n=1 Tax=Agaribacterium haliotis TaxID=2013869 RepID=UPI000BB58DFC|nr:PilZ domain-containing protein [Agaribacterium haliotis]
MSHELRQKPRFRLRTYVTVFNRDGDAAQSKSIEAHLLNISEHGALIAVLEAQQQKNGEQLKLLISLNKHTKLELNASIAHQKAHYLGLRFGELSSSQKQALQDLLNELA